MTKWLGLTLTREVKKANGKVETIRTTNEWAIAYAAKRFGVSEDQIELQRDRAIIKVRAIPDDEEEVEFMSLEQFTFECYGFPNEDDEFYQDFKNFGYSTWLVKKYPEEWGVGDRQEMLANLKQDYYWYMLEEYLEVDLPDDLDSLGAVLSDELQGACIVYPIEGVAFENTLNLPCFELGILVFEEESSLFVIFIGDDGEFYPMSVSVGAVEITEYIFEGFE